MGSYEEKASVVETIYRLGFALDALNYHELAPLFHPTKPFNFDIYAILKTPARDVTLAEYFKTATGGLGGFDATQHMLTSPIVTLGDGGKTAHVKVMVTALHALMVEGGGLEGATARVTWNIDLEREGERWVVVKWRIGGLVPMDRPDIMHKGHERAQKGQVRASIVGP